jgi:hypothetical protein
MRSKFSQPFFRHNTRSKALNDIQPPLSYEAGFNPAAESFRRNQFSGTESKPAQNPITPPGTEEGADSAEDQNEQSGQ